MKKKFNYYVIAWIVALIMFHTIIFVVPVSDKWNGVFFPTYICIIIAFVFQLLCTFLALKEENKKFYHLPLITISYSTLIILLVTGMLCLLVPAIPNWLAIIISILVLGISVISVIKAKAASSIISEKDEKNNKKTTFIKELISSSESLIKKAKSKEMKEVVIKVYEAIRYSNLSSSEALKDIESQIQSTYNQLTKGVIEDNMDEVKTLVDELIILLDERNQKCKVLK